MHRQGTKECKNNLTPGSLLREIRPKKKKIKELTTEGRKFI
jgi:hypothetical protein